MCTLKIRYDCLSQQFKLTEGIVTKNSSKTFRQWHGLPGGCFEGEDFHLDK